MERRRYSLQELRSRGQALLSERELDEEALDEREASLGAQPRWEGAPIPEPLDTPLSFLPPEARKVGFMELAVMLAADPRGYALLTGVERGPAGLDKFRSSRSSWGPSGDDEPAGSFSFCVNGTTYTAFESSCDDMRSSMRDLVARDGNWCSVRFEPCALIPEFVSCGSWDDERDGRRWRPSQPEAGMADMLELCVPGSSIAAVSVGTNRADDWYPSFVGWHDPQALQRAVELRVSLSYELDAELPPAPAEAPRRRPGL